MDWTISVKRAYEFVSAPTIESLVQELNEADKNGYEICGGPVQKGSNWCCIVRRVTIKRYLSVRDFSKDQLDDFKTWAGLSEQQEQGVRLVDQ